MRKPDFLIKIADQPFEFEQIQQLNYQTFVEEIPQHNPAINNNKTLRDKFHDENVYIIAVVEKEVIGMLAYRGKRPFSLDEKLPDLDQYFSHGCYPGEVRLLTVKKQYRHFKVFFSLFEKILEYCFDQGHNSIVISAVVTQVKLYRHMGFRAFGPLLFSGSTHFQAMIIDLVNIKYKMNKNEHNPLNKLFQTAYLLPGPVRSFKGVEEAFAQPPISHRTTLFKDLFLKTQTLLANLVNANYVQIMMGGGTLANDMVALQLKQLNEPGLILANGEFGERLIQHATRAGLVFKVIHKEWGLSFSKDEIANKIKSNTVKWVWAVHCETSTGMINNLAMLNSISENFHIKLILDCVSSFASVPLDLSKVFLASGSSAKAIGAKTGLAFVFHNQLFPKCLNLPAVLDLGYYISHQGIPFTLSSSLLIALKTALEWFNNPGIWFRTQQLSFLIRQALKEKGVSVLLDESLSSPAIITVTLPKSINSKYVGDRFTEQGILLHYNNSYLQTRNWIQIVLMGRLAYRDVKKLLNNISFFLEEYDNKLVSMSSEFNFS